MVVGTVHADARFFAEELVDGREEHGVGVQDHDTVVLRECRPVVLELLKLPESLRQSLPREGGPHLVQRHGHGHEARLQAQQGKHPALLLLPGQAVGQDREEGRAVRAPVRGAAQGEGQDGQAVPPAGLVHGAVGQDGGVGHAEPRPGGGPLPQQHRAKGRILRQQQHAGQGGQGRQHERRGEADAEHGAAAPDHGDSSCGQSRVSCGSVNSMSAALIRDTWRME
mmetsp:Transcript_91140/g.221299  ORF Transcript_91140/g.221299 Transcript_91140/m.221299 type:complete len:225 (+) Transcript_91140:604-1278(+)